MNKGKPTSSGGAAIIAGSGLGRTIKRFPVKH